MGVFPDTHASLAAMRALHRLFQAVFNQVFTETSQYAMGPSNFDEPDADGSRFCFGFIASTDDHTSRPGTGFKQYGRRKEVYGTSGLRMLLWFDLLNPPSGQLPMGSEAVCYKSATLPNSSRSAMQQPN